jgi:FMN phosphatase YigB (HAD superfamily)
MTPARDDIINSISKIATDFFKKLFQDVPSLLLQLKTKGFQLGIITNGPTEYQLNKIKSLGLTAFFPRDLLFISDEVGVAKPNPAIFHYTAQKVNKSCEDLLYIGDTWENDVVAPINAGWQSIWFNHRQRQPVSKHKPFAEIKCLSKILDFTDEKTPRSF